MKSLKASSAVRFLGGASPRALASASLFAKNPVCMAEHTEVLSIACLKGCVPCLHPLPSCASNSGISPAAAGKRSEAYAALYAQAPWEATFGQGARGSSSSCRISCSRRGGTCPAVGLRLLLC